jgi:hypothetical protein
MRFADDQHQLAVTLPRPFPPPQQHRYFLVTANKRREIALRRSASAAACAHQLEQRGRLRDALERVRASLLGDEEARDLALNPRRDQNRAGLGQRLHPRRDVGDVPVNLARRVHHCRTGFETDAGGKFRLAGTRVLAVELSQCTLDCECRAHRALGIVLVRNRIAEQRHQPVAELLGDMAAHLRHRRRRGVEIRADEIAPLLGIELGGNAGRTNQIAEHHGEVTALAHGFNAGTQLRRRLGGGNRLQWSNRYCRGCYGRRCSRRRRCAI